MKKTGLYFGTFNPIHVGHLIIANYMVDFTELDEVWLVVSPQNPFKVSQSMLADYHRLALARIAVEDNPRLRVSDAEFSLSKPSFTIHTLLHLAETHPNRAFALIMGEDNLRSLHKWKGYQEILSEHLIYVYPRVLMDAEKQELLMHRSRQRTLNHPSIRRVDAPVMKLSSSFIRKAIAAGHDVRYLLTEPVYQYVKEMHFYEK